MARQQFNDGEEVVYQDHNDLQARVEQEYADDVLYRLFQEEDGFIGNGLSVTYIDPATVQVNPGRGFQYDNSVADTEPKYRGIDVDDPEQYSLPAPDATNPRIDLLVVKSDREVILQENRKVKNALDQTITTELLDKASKYAADVQVIEGTAAPAPVAPSVPAGYLALAEVYSNAGSGPASQSDVTDKRNILRVATNIGVNVNSSAFVRVTTKEVKAPLQTILAEMDQSIDDSFDASNDASEINYAPADVNDWDGAVDPGQVKDGLDQLAARQTSTEGDVSVLESKMDYTPANLPDWDSSTDPGELPDAADQLAARVKVLEGAGGGGIGTVLPGGSTLSGTYEGVLLVTGDCDLGGDVVVKGDLLIEGSLDNLENHDLLVKQDCFVAGGVRYVPGPAFEMGYLTVEGDLYVGENQLPGPDFDGDINFAFSTDEFIYNQNLESQGVVVGSTFEVISGVDAGATALVTNVSGSFVEIDTPLSGTPNPGDVHRFSTVSDYSLTMKRNSLGGTNNLKVGGDMHLYGIDGVPQDVDVAGLSVDCGGDIYRVRDGQTTETIFLSALDGGNGAPGGSINVDGNVYDLNIETRGSESTGATPGGQGGEVNLGGFYSGSSAKIITVAGGENTGTGSGGSASNIKITGNLVGGVTKIGGDSAAASGGLTGSLLVRGNCTVRSSLSLNGGNGQTGGGSAGSISIEGNLTHWNAAISSNGGNSLGTGALYNAGNAGGFFVNGSATGNTVQLIGGLAVEGEGGDGGAMQVQGSANYSANFRTQGGQSQSGPYFGGRAQDISINGNFNGVSADIRANGGSSVGGTGGAGGQINVNGYCAADTVTSQGGDGSNVNGLPRNINFNGGCAVDYVIHKLGAGAGSNPTTVYKVSMSGYCNIQRLFQSSAGNLRLESGSINAMVRIAIFDDKDTFEYGGTPTGGQSANAPNSIYIWDSSASRWNRITGSLI
jgi:hypothetical protein